MTDCSANITTVKVGYSRQTSPRGISLHSSYFHEETFAKSI